jgi:membrane-associated phospholipid phosphatase
MLTRIDNDYNAFPSLHVAYAVFHSACCHALSLSRNIQESGRGGTRPSTTCECRGFSTRGGTASTPSESISTGSSSSSGTARKLVPWVFWGWTLGIAVSTLLTKQHVFVDVIAGAVLGLGSYRICCQPLKMPWAHRRHA